MRRHLRGRGPHPQEQDRCRDRVLGRAQHSLQCRRARGHAPGARGQRGASRGLGVQDERPWIILLVASRAAGELLVGVARRQLG
eukprot:4591347-Lingulodinium_polyedra.AAC.1